MSRPRPLWAPPARDGVSASRVAVTPGPWGTLADFLATRLPAVRDWPERLARGDVLDAQGHPVTGDAPCRPGALLWYWRSVPAEPRVPFEIELLHQDEHLVAVDKPHFLSVTPGGRHLQETVLVRLKRLLGLDELVPVHRLDRETAGVLLFSVQPATRHAYQALWRDRAVHKVYEAIAPVRSDLALPMDVHTRLEERPGGHFMQMQEVPGEPNARTRVELLAELGPRVEGRGRDAGTAVERFGHYRLTPHTGRKHQLRAQMSALGLPILGDRIYPVLQAEPAAGIAPDFHTPLQLLARELRFTDPLTGAPRCFTSRRQLQALDARP